MKHDVYTVVYALVLGCLCSVLLTAAGEFTEPRRKANAEAEEIRNILRVLDISYEPKAQPAELIEIYDRMVRKVEGSGITNYVYAVDGSVQAVAIPLAGPGLWGPVKGFLALEGDRRTIRGIAFHEQEETPGLGGEIASDKFTSQFKGKKIADDSGKAGIDIRMDGSAQKSTEVDGISGATMTCDKVEAMLKSAMEKIVNESGAK